MEYSGNSWTPKGFGGSVALDKATGALPILNTVSGGNYATVGVRTDANAANLVLALPLVGSANDVSNSVNSGSTTKAITVTNAAVSSDTSNFYNGSFEFDGSGDYLDTSANADFAFGTGDFTVECWIYNEGHSATGNVVDGRTDTKGWGLQLSSSENFTFYSKVSASSVLGDMGPIVENKWTHLAVTRSSGTLYGFIDGVLQNSASHTSDYSDNTPVVIGARYSKDQQYFNGYIQDVRVYKGTAKYTSNFIPASTNPDILPDTPSGVSGGSKLTKVTDGAVSFDGSGSDYLVVGDGVSTDLAPGTGVFTIEFYLYPKTMITSAPGILQWSATNNTQTSYTNAGFVAWNSTGSITLQLGASSITTGAGKVPINKWSHIAIQRSTGNEFRLYVDGILITSDNSTLGNPDTSSKYLVLGKYYTGNNYALNGFISNFRLIKGTALYTSNFTPPTRELTNVTNTKLLCCQSNTSAVDTTVVPGTAPNTGNWSARSNWNSGGNFN